MVFRDVNLVKSEIKMLSIFDGKLKEQVNRDVFSVAPHALTSLAGPEVQLIEPVWSSWPIKPLVHS